MKAAYKLFWFYICDECDHAGIWDIDFDVACIRIGEDVNEKDALGAFFEKVIVFDGGKKWFFPSFIDFQYGVLDLNNRVHLSVFHKLKKYGLDEYVSIHGKENKTLIRPLEGCKDMDMVKDKDKVKDKDGEFDQFDAFEYLLSAYPSRIGEAKARKLFFSWEVTDEMFFRMKKAIVNYKAHLNNCHSRKFQKNPQNINNWLESWTDWENHVEQLTPEQKDAAIMARLKEPKKCAQK